MVKNKKGQLGGFGSIALTIVIIGILIGVGFLVLSEFRETMSETSNTVYNESVTPTDTGVYLAYNSSTASVNCYSNLNVLYVMNRSGALIIQPGNYTYNTYTGLFRNISMAVGYNAGWNVTYTYTSGTDACEGIDDTIDATEAVPTFIPIVVIIAIVGILLAIVFGFVIPKAGGKTAEI